MIEVKRGRGRPKKVPDDKPELKQAIRDWDKPEPVSVIDIWLEPVQEKRDIFYIISWIMDNWVKVFVMGFLLVATVYLAVRV